MFGSDALEVAIGVVFVYLLLSLLCTALRELIEAVVKSRATDLERGVRELLRSGDLTAAFYRHPLINALYSGAYRGQTSAWRSTNLPSYIPARNFGLALLDIAARGQPNATADARTQAFSPAASATRSTPAITAANVRLGIENIGNPDVQRVVLTALDTAQNDLAAAQANLEAWYNSSMDRVSGWYRRRTQTILLVLGVAAAVVGNVNTIGIATYLFQNRTARDALTASATAYVQAEQTRHATSGTAPETADGAAGAPAGSAAAAPSVNDAFTRVATHAGKLAALPLPIGWRGPHPLAVAGDDGTIDGAWSQVIAPVLGLLLTGLAVTLGAPFWFDVLNRIMVIRSTVKPHEKSPEEASEDRQSPAAPTLRLTDGVAPRADAADGHSGNGVNRIGGTNGTAANASDVPLTRVDPEAAVDGCAVALARPTGARPTADAELPTATGGIAPR